MTISKWPKNERPRDKLISQGVGSLSDSELLAIFIRTGVPGLTAVDLARGLLNTFKGIRGVLEANVDEFCGELGLGISKYAQLHAATELVRRQMLEKIQREDMLTSTKLTREYVKTKMRDYKREVFLCLFLDNQHRIIAQEELFKGTIDSSMVHPREVVKRSLYHNAAALIFAHNHPSGIAEPSQSDISITQRLKAALAIVDIRTLDHLVVGDCEVTSLAERGLM